MIMGENAHLPSTAPLSKEMGRIKKSQRRTRAPFSWKRGGVATFAPNFSTAQEELGEGSEGARPGLPVWPWGVTRLPGLTQALTVGSSPLEVL